ncbi:Hypothetical predicted protein, partial [Prunus dulcis]
EEEAEEEEEATLGAKRMINPIFCVLIARNMATTKVNAIIRDLKIRGIMLRLQRMIKEMKGLSCWLIMLSVMMRKT